MRKLLFVTLISVSLNCICQNRFDTPAQTNYRSTYVSPDFGAIQKALEYRQGKYDQNLAYLKSLKDWIIDIKGKTNERILINKLDGSYEMLKRLESTDLSLAYNDLQKIEFEIKENILAYNKRVEEQASNIETTEKIEALHLKANEYISQNDYYQAVSVFNQILNSDPNSVTALYGRAYSNYMLGSNELVLQDLNRILNLDETFSNAYVLSGYVYERSGKYEEAIKIYTKYLVISPPSAEIYFRRGFSKNQIGDFDGAISDYNKTIELSPNFSMAYNNIGYMHCEKGNYEIALEYVNKALNLDTKNFYAWNSRGEILFHQKKYDEAIKSLDYAIKLAPEDAFSYLIRGRAKYRLGKKSEACDDWQKSLDLGEFKAFEYTSKYCD